MSILSKIFSKSAATLLDSGGRIIDNLTTTDKEKLDAKNKLSEIVLDSLATIQKAQSDVILSETKGNWLQRSWRPILMLAFGFIVVYAYFIEPAFILSNGEVGVAQTLRPEFWSLLKLGVGGYIIGRSTEKVATTVTKNTDIAFFKKKDRKDIYG